MKTILLRCACTFLYGLFLLVDIEPLVAREGGTPPATHVWIYASNSMMYGPAVSLGACRMLVQQASGLNSAMGHCYNGAQFLEEIRCQKGHKKGEASNCTYKLEKSP